MILKIAIEKTHLLPNSGKFLQVGRISVPLIREIMEKNGRGNGTA